MEPGQPPPGAPAAKPDPGAEGGAGLAALHLEQDPVAGDGTFRVTANFGAVLGCAEDYTLSGAFTDADHFDATLRIEFSGDFCVLTNCSNQALEVGGARR